MVRRYGVLLAFVVACEASSSDSVEPTAGADSATSGGSGSAGESAGPGNEETGAVTTTTSASAETSSSGPGDGESESGSPEPSNRTPGCGMPMTGDVLDGVIEVAGEQRRYIIEIPENYDPETPYPLIFGFHGDSDAGVNAQNGYRLSEHYAGQAIVVYPDGSGAGGSPAWNTSNGGPDLTMVMSLAQEIGLEMCFDLERVHAFGYSRGAAMANAVGCYRGDFFKGIGASSGWAPSTGLCQGPIAIFVSHGISDTAVPFGSGVNARNAWAAYNGCSEQTVELTEPGCVAYEGCDAGAPVQWCEFEGGHTFNGDYARMAVELFESL